MTKPGWDSIGTWLLSTAWMLLDAQYNPVNSTSPTSASAAILIYCTGLGAVTNQPSTGSPALINPLSWTTMVPVVSIGGATAGFFPGWHPAALD
jgi:uncharacterized protein (TIGR03437 family)